MNRGGLALKVISRGELCATGSAALPDGRPRRRRRTFSRSRRRRTSAPAGRRDLLAVGRWLGMNPLTVTAEFHAQDLAIPVN